MGRPISSKKYTIYGKEYRVDFVSEEPGTTRCCYEIYKMNGEYVGSATDMTEVFEVVREERFG